MIQLRKLVPEGTHLPHEQRLQFREYKKGLGVLDYYWADWKDVPVVVEGSEDDA